MVKNGHTENNVTKIQMWKISIIMAVMILSVLLIYTGVYNHSLSLLAISQAVAGTAAVMIGISFAQGGLVYYFQVFPNKLHYRKYIGLVGFWLAYVYSLILLVLDPDRYFFGFFHNLFTLDFIFGLGAMTILAFMAIISLDGVRIKLGKSWRSYFQLGYLAFIFLIVRGIILESDIWLEWLANPNGLLPPRLLVSIIAVSVILLRISLMISLLKEKS